MRIFSEIELFRRFLLSRPGIALEYKNRQSVLFSKWKPYVGAVGANVHFQPTYFTDSYTSRLHLVIQKTKSPELFRQTRYTNGIVIIEETTWLS